MTPETLKSSRGYNPWRAKEKDEDVKRRRIETKKFKCRMGCCFPEKKVERWGDNCAV